MKITNKQLKNYLDFLNEYKELVGMADWKISIKFSTKEDVASILPDIFEKEAILTLGDKFFNATKERQQNTLMHELMHCRVCIYKEHLEQYIDIMEEHFVNDITRGFEKVLSDKWNIDSNK